MPAHVFAQLEFPVCIVERLPGCRTVGVSMSASTCRRQFLVFIRLHQRLKDMAQRAVMRADVVMMRIHRGDRGLQPNGNIARIDKFGGGRLGRSGNRKTNRGKDNRRQYRKKTVRVNHRYSHYFWTEAYLKHD